MENLKRVVTPGGQEFTFSGKPRKLEQREAVPFRWPSKASVANEYIVEWEKQVTKELSELRLSCRTASTIASHVSRRDGALRMTDAAMSARSGRKLRSTKRDIQRLKNLGFLMAEYEAGSVVQERVRVLRLAVPGAKRSGQRIPPAFGRVVGPTYPLYVGPLDTGASRDV